MKTPEQTELVKQAQEGDEQAFTDLVKTHQNLVLGYAFNRLGDFHRAQEVVQETIIIAHAKLGSLNDPEAFSGWLRGIALHLFISHSCVSLVSRAGLDRPETRRSERELCQKRGR
jgi:RNA polymerase sigma-70 factor (ECF subfamily)